LQAKSANFKGLVFIPETEKLLLWDLKWKGKAQIDVYVFSEGEIKMYRDLKSLW